MEGEGKLLGENGEGSHILIFFGVEGGCGFIGDPSGHIWGGLGCQTLQNVYIYCITAIIRITRAFEGWGDL